MRIYKENGKVIVELTGYDVLFTDNSVQDTVRIESASDDVVLKINTVNEDGIATGVMYVPNREEYVAINKAMQRARRKVRLYAALKALNAEFRADLESGKSAIVVDEHTKDGTEVK
jgi:DNA polymerase II large subunit